MPVPTVAVVGRMYLMGQRRLSVPSSRHRPAKQFR
jgi:hypothetical protein